MENRINTMIEAAIGGDVLTGEDCGFVSIMGKSAPNIRQDVPAAFEAYALLDHFLDKLPLKSVVMDTTSSMTDLSPAILYDETASRLVALLPIDAAGLAAVAYWLTSSIRSAQIKQFPGVLALPFSIENHSGVDHLLPEWFAAFYVHGEAGHCIPILVLQSVLADQRFGGDWVTLALERMVVFALPHEQAASTIRNHSASINT